MPELFINKYAPLTLKDYISDQYTTILYYLDNFFKGKTGKGFILFGKPGVGKSALITVIGNHYDAEMFILNASDSRNSININAINTSSILNKRRIIVLEEIDGFNKQRFNELAKTIESAKNPIILICNDIKLIDNIVKSKCYQKEITVNRFSLKILAERIIKAENLNISKDKLNEVLKSTDSYRGILDYLEFGIITNKGSFETTEKLKDTIQFTSDNSSSPELISIADIYFKRSQQGYKSGEKISKFILNNINKTSDDYPRTYKLLYEVKHKKKSTGKISIIGFK